MIDIDQLYTIKRSIKRSENIVMNKEIITVASCAVIKNPLVHYKSQNLADLARIGKYLGDILSHNCMENITGPVVSYGKAALIGSSGIIEHGAAIIHPQMGKPMRDAIGGGKSLIPSNVKIGAVGADIDIPLCHKDDPWSFDEIDTITVSVPGSPLPDEIIVVIVFANGGRPLARVDKELGMVV